MPEISPPSKPYQIIDITDPGKDLDDEQKFILEAGLMRRGFILLRAVVANLKPSFRRARLAKGTLEKLGFDTIPVGVGTDCFTEGDNSEHEANVPYLAQESVVVEGHGLLTKTLRQSQDKSIILMLNSGMTDAANLLRQEQELFLQKIAGVTLMGGVKISSPSSLFLEGGYMVPDDAANNAFDVGASEYLYLRLQELGVPMTIITRHSCRAAQFSVRLYDQFDDIGHPVGQSLKKRHQETMQQLWRAALSPDGSSARGSLPLSRNREWFVQIFCEGLDPGISYGEPIWPYVRMYNQSDSMAVIAAVPELQERFFSPIEVSVNNAVHRVIGLSNIFHGVKDRRGLIDFVRQMELEALKASL